MPNTVADYPDSDLVRRAVRNCRANSRNKGVLHPRWVAVMETFSLGRTYSQELCCIHDLDPDEMVKR